MVRYNKTLHKETIRFVYKVIITNYKEGDEVSFYDVREIIRNYPEEIGRIKNLYTQRGSLKTRFKKLEEFGVLEEKEERDMYGLVKILDDDTLEHLLDEYAMRAPGRTAESDKRRMTKSLDKEFKISLKEIHRDTPWD